MKRHGKKLETKGDKSMSFSEFVQRIIQRDASGVEQEIQKPKTKKGNPNLARVERNITKSHLTEYTTERASRTKPVLAKVIAQPTDMPTAHRGQRG